MNRYALAAALVMAGGAQTAYAKCTVVADVPNNIQFLSCSSDTQANDGDDLKLFIDGVGTATSATGSLGKNSNAANFQNVTIQSDNPFEFSSDANGFANFKSVADDVTQYEATPLGAGTNLVAKNGALFKGFDGELFRGQLENQATGTWDHDVTVVVNLSNGKTFSHLFTGFKLNTDIGVLGFDEINDPGVFVKSAFAFAGNTTTTGASPTGSWEEFKQIEFSVPGQVATVPEPRTWVMLMLGFGLMGLMARKARARLAAY